jgi:hypothetical protein
VLDASDPGGDVVSEDASAGTGDLRVKQKGGTITARYRDASTNAKWRTIGTSPAYTEPVSLGLRVWGERDAIPSDVAVKLTTFRFTGLCV